ncbi:hypothetical protein [Streptomyces mirabilis]|uniref:hypothetical protein n=1 Tax=Streptomyces mirabilis TaxID=68239 RepID=UPI002E344AB5|nr:hypothetical protein [Streptomyces mirabilis]
MASSLVARLCHWPVNSSSGVVAWEKRRIVSTLRVHAVSGDATVSEVQWSGRFVPTDASEADVVALFTGIYGDGLEALIKALS